MERAESTESTDLSPGVAHLRMLARAPRAAGSEGERVARDYCASELRALGFEVSVEPFDYSAFPGRYGTPVAGALAMATVLVPCVLGGIHRAPRAGATALLIGLVALVLFASRMLGEGVLDLPWLRRRGENLVARRGGAAPRVWLVAHVDSKSQPIPSRTRVFGVVLLALALVLTASALVMTLALGSTRTMLYLASVALAGAGARGVIYSVVGNESPGAVDNASGVAAVLAAAAMLGQGAAVGVLIPSAEELGLAGARAWVRAHADERVIVLNCDGVDDHGELTLMYTRTKPDEIVNAVAGAAGDALRVQRMPPGLLLDSVAFSGAGWTAATVSYGSMRTLARVHTRHDSLENLRGRSIDPVAGVLARAAEALAR